MTDRDKTKVTFKPGGVVPIVKRGVERAIAPAREVRDAPQR